MSSTTLNNGRFCNQLIRNLCVSLIAEKQDLFVSYANYYNFKSLGLDLYIGKNKFINTINLNDDNFFDILNMSNNTLKSNLNPNNNYFQTKEIMDYLYNYLNTENIKNNIILNNSYNERYNSNNDCFIHIRLGDVSNKNPGFEYYKKVLDTLTFDKLYIASDSLNHEIVKRIQSLYNNKTIFVNTNEVDTIQFGSTNKYIILSHGSFSAVIGYLSFFSQVYYPKYEECKRWYGDMFSIKGWNDI